jgi:hypothetical protein
MKAQNKRKEKRKTENLSTPWVASQAALVLGPELDPIASKFLLR